MLLANGYPAIDKSITLALHLAASAGAGLTALYVIDSRWDDILGDEWISNYQTRRDFYRYFEQGLKKQAETALDYIAARGAGCNIPVRTLIEKEIPEKTIISAASRLGCEGLLVLPLPPQNAEGALNINPGKLIKKVTCPVLAIPEFKKVPGQ